ncbi:MAG TPA: HIT family protein [Acidimicrobiia bacterium]|nr:HIT family protein [Acidimicrobiia bacterium]
MPTVFSRIISGELPGHFVHRDERCAAFLSIAPLQPGHTLVVPVEEVDDWTDADRDLLGHLMTVARSVGRAQHRVYRPVKVGLMIAGLEVPHLHLHVLPIGTVHDLDFSNADSSVTSEQLAAEAEKLRAAMADL